MQNLIRGAFVCVKPESLPDRPFSWKPRVSGGPRYRRGDWRASYGHTESTCCAAQAWLPVIGFAPSHDNLVIATGHQMCGLHTAPGTGRLVAELITSQTPFVDAAPFRVGRFDPEQVQSRAATNRGARWN